MTDSELGQALLQGAQTALAALLSGDKEKVQAAEQALRNTEESLIQALTELGVKTENASKDLPKAAQDLLKKISASKAKEDGIWAVARAETAMQVGSALKKAADKKDTKSGQFQLNPELRQRILEIADALNDVGGKRGSQHRAQSSSQNRSQQSSQQSSQQK